MTGELARLVYMANQIATALRLRNDAVAATCDHLSQFWDPRMRRLIVEHLRAGGDDLNDIARPAVERLGERARREVGAGDGG